MADNVATEAGLEDEEECIEDFLAFREHMCKLTRYDEQEEDEAHQPAECVEILSDTDEPGCAVAGYDRVEAMNNSGANLSPTNAAGAAADGDAGLAEDGLLLADIQDNYNIGIDQAVEQDVPVRMEVESLDDDVGEDFFLDTVGLPLETAGGADVGEQDAKPTSEEKATNLPRNIRLSCHPKYGTFCKARDCLQRACTMVKHKVALDHLTAAKVTLDEAVHGSMSEECLRQSVEAYKLVQMASEIVCSCHANQEELHVVKLAASSFRDLLVWMAVSVSGVCDRSTCLCLLATAFGSALDRTLRSQMCNAYHLVLKRRRKQQPKRKQRGKKQRKNQQRKQRQKQRQKRQQQDGPGSMGRRRKRQQQGVQLELHDGGMVSASCELGGDKDDMAGEDTPEDGHLPEAAQDVVVDDHEAAEDQEANEEADFFVDTIGTQLNDGGEEEAGIAEEADDEEEEVAPSAEDEEEEGSVAQEVLVEEDEAIIEEVVIADDDEEEEEEAEATFEQEEAALEEETAAGEPGELEVVLSSELCTAASCKVALTTVTTQQEEAAEKGSGAVEGAVSKSSLQHAAQQVPASSSKAASGAAGYLFMCNNRTQEECESLHMFAAPHGELARMQRSITSDTQLLLLNFQTLVLMGPFFASGPPEHDIEPDAFSGKFRSQIRVAPREEPLMEMKVAMRIPSGPKAAAEVAAMEVGLWSGWGRPARKKVQEAWFKTGRESTTIAMPSLEQQSEHTSVCSTNLTDEVPQESEMIAEETRLIRQQISENLIDDGMETCLSDEPEVHQRVIPGSMSTQTSELDEGGNAFSDPYDVDSVGVTVDAGAEFREAYDSLPDADEVVEISEGIEGETSDADEPAYKNAWADVHKDGHEVDALAMDAEAPKSASSSTSAIHDTGNANGYVFFCSSATQRECAKLKLLGSPEMQMEHMKHTISPETLLFLYNFESKKLLGTFTATSEPELNIDPRAFMRRFGAQVRVAPRLPLHEVKLPSRPSAGGKTVPEVVCLMALLLKGGEATEQVQQAWSADPCDEPPSKRQKVGGGEIGSTSRGTVGDSSRPFNLQQVVVNFANVGASYAEKVLGRDPKRGDRIFDWEGVRRCIRCLIEEQGMQVIGVLFENFKGPDNGSQHWQGVPMDIVQMCTFIQETPCLTGKNHKSADDEVTIKCAFRRNCRFLDNDNYRDWLNNMRNQKVRAWLEKWQDLLQMRYFFDRQMGSFDTLDGNIPTGLLALGQR